MSETDPERRPMSDSMALKQGHLGLLESDVARRLLASRIPARFAYIAEDGAAAGAGDVVSLDG
jgi:hypothetical protein